MAKLLMISTDRKIFEGNSDVALRQAEYAKKWQEVHIIVFAGRNFPRETVVSDNCWAYATHSLHRIFYPHDAIRIGRFLCEKRGITEITCQDASFTAMAGVALKDEFHIPLEIQIHEDLGSRYYSRSLESRLRKVLAAKYLPRADAIRVVSARIRDYLTGSLGIEPRKIMVRPIEVDTDKIRNAPVLSNLKEKYPQFDRIALMSSRFEKEKNFELALGAWKLVLREFPRAGLVIVGEGSQKDNILRYASKLQMEKSVVVESWADKPTLFSYYKTADVFLNTSYSEGYGMSLVEANAAGARIVSTDVGVSREVGAAIAEFYAESFAGKIIDIFKKNDQLAK